MPNLFVAVLMLALSVIDCMVLKRQYQLVEWKHCFDQDLQPKLGQCHGNCDENAAYRTRQRQSGMEKCYLQNYFCSLIAPKTKTSVHQRREKEDLSIISDETGENTKHIALLSKLIQNFLVIPDKRNGLSHLSSEKDTPQKILSQLYPDVIHVGSLGEYKLLWSGSRAEGIGLRVRNRKWLGDDGVVYTYDDLDEDIMVEIQHVKGTFPGEKYDNEASATVVFVPGGYPGYRYVCVKDKSMQTWTDIERKQLLTLLEVNQDGYIRNTPRNSLVYELYQDYLDSNGRKIDLVGSLEKVGPAVTANVTESKTGTNGEASIENYSLDLVVAIHSRQWPPSAVEWISRKKRSGWPSPHVIEEIIRRGCHVVPKFDARSSNRSSESLEWRLSFSLAEKTLAQSLTLSQRNCYRVLKAIMKLHTTIPSYYLKSITFRQFENSIPEIWLPDKIGLGFMAIIDSLVHCLQTKFVPHYFIDNLNLLDSRAHFSVKELESTLSTVKSMKTELLPTLLRVHRHLMSTGRHHSMM